MPQYRVYILGEQQQLVGAGDFQSADDETAVDRVNELLDGHEGELWRLVARFNSTVEPSSPEPDADRTSASHEGLIGGRRRRRRDAAA